METKENRIEQILAEGDLVAAHQRDGLIVQAWDEMDSGGILKKLVG
ncbi:MAG TPA: hypothetical protein VLL27_13175 [Solirubrobacterales bacterium]|nr:hypothetical protein [Solirubrobacterales bacterium]